MPLVGLLVCIASAMAFGVMGVFGTLAYGEGATVGTLLSFRFAVAATLFWVLVAATPARHALRAVGRRDAALALALGAVVYAAQAGCYFAALRRIDAGLLGLLVYTFPTIVTVAAIALGREHGDVRTLLALVLATAGIALVLGGGAAGTLDPAGTVLGLATAVVYAGYVLICAGPAGRVDPLLLSALVCTGAAVTLTVAAAAAGDLRPGDVSVAGLGWLAAIAAISTVVAVALFFAGLARVGPTAAAILSAAEPLTAVVLTGAVFGRTLSMLQMAGAGLVVGGVLTLAVRAGRRVHRPAGGCTIIRGPARADPLHGRSPS